MIGATAIAASAVMVVVLIIVERWAHTSPAPEREVAA
jgi:hypothetical protein